MEWGTHSNGSLLVARLQESVELIGLVKHWVLGAAKKIERNDNGFAENAYHAEKRDGSVRIIFLTASRRSIGCVSAMMAMEPSTKREGTGVVGGRRERLAGVRMDSFIGAVLEPVLYAVVLDIRVPWIFDTGLKV